MGVADVLWDLEPATEAKHRLYRSYLDAWWAKMLQPAAKSGYRHPRVTYVDAFAGPGRYTGGEEGSPVFVLDRLLKHESRDRMDLRQDRVRLVFIERDRDRYEYLREELHRCFGDLEQLRVRVEIRHGDAGDETQQALTDLGGWGHPVLAIFDSWGNVNVPFPLMRRLAGNKSSEVITTFGPNWFNRREGQDPEALDAVFGGRQHWERAHRETSSEERWRAWLETYRDALRRAGFGHRLQFQVKPHSGQPLYLVYGTGHPAGVEAMKEAMWNVDADDGMRFIDPRSRGGIALGQESLFGPATEGSDPELCEFVLRGLDHGPTTMETLGDWVLEETARWRRQDARAAVEHLRDSGYVAVDPPSKRVTKNNVITRL